MSEVILKRGLDIRPDKVKTYQQMLKKLGFYEGLIDGDFGPLTEAAVKAFQQEYQVTGQIDEDTRDAIAYAYHNYKELATLHIKKYPLSSMQYIAESTPKDNITLHLTAGGANAHWVHSSWTLDRAQGKYAVGTPYVISGRDVFEHNPHFNTQDGEIFEFFNPRYWAYHVNMNPDHNKNNLGIEICNLGPLQKLEDGLFVAYANGAVVPQDQVEQIDFRGFSYWHRISDGQLESLYDLLSVLLQMYPGVACSVADQDFGSSWADYNLALVEGATKGIYPHTAWVKEEEKRRFDMPAFPRLLEVLKSLQPKKVLRRG